VNSTDEHHSTSYSGRGLFDFDFFALGFAALCLRLLPAPSTIFSPTPFATADSWPIQSPGQSQYDALNRAVEDRSRLVQRQWQARPSNGSITSSQIPTEISDLNKFYSHITDAYHHWNLLDMELRQETWQLEVLRAYAQAEEDRKESENTIDSLRRQIDTLTTSLERANAGWGGQSSLGPYPLSSYSAVTSPRLSNDLVKELCKQGVDFRGWDYTRLMDKWKGVVREERKAAHGLGAQRALPNTMRTRQPSHHVPHPPLNGHAEAGSRSTNTASAISAAPPTRTDSMDSGSRDADADAEGEEDADGDADGDEELDDSVTETEESSHRREQQLHHQRNPSDLQQHNTLLHQQNPSLGLAGPSPQNIQPTNGGPRYGWHPQEMGVAASTRAYAPVITRLPPGPNDWNREIAHAMEGVEGSATGT
jgi:hypothetical protein